MQVQGPYPQQWAPFKATGLLHAWQISHQISRCLYHEGWWLRASTLCYPSLSAASKSPWASQAHAFHQPVCQRLSWPHCWRVPSVLTSGDFFLSVWGPGLQCHAVQAGVIKFFSQPLVQDKWPVKIHLSWGIFYLSQNISVTAHLSVRLQIPLFLIQNAIQIKQL